MRFILILFFVTFSLEATTLKVFTDQEVTLPDSCYMVVRGGHENGFTCPVPSDRFRSISFPLVGEFSPERLEQKKKVSEHAELNDVDFRMLSVESAEIDGRFHGLEVWQTDGISNFSYTICDYRSCIRFSANDYNFVHNLAVQVSTKVISKG